MKIKGINVLSSSLAIVLMMQCVSGLLPIALHTHQSVAFHRGGRLYSAAAVAAPDLMTELTSEGLALCHGILHASGVRRLSDIKGLSESQITSMGVDSTDRLNLLRVMDGLGEYDNSIISMPPQQELSTLVDGAFERVAPKRFEATPKQDFSIEVICAENNIYKGRLFTEEQCKQISRMAEYSAYYGVKAGTVGAGWTDQIYTLTAQHMKCKDVPGLLPTTKHTFDQLKQELYSLFPGIRQGSIVFENENEPHLVKYNGKAKGTQLHTDNSEYVYLTLNVVLSAEDDFGGGGTYITAIDETIRLKQGEMLIHLGDLEHAGADISSGVRNLLICFYACQWENEELNKAKPEQARDYTPLLF